MGEDIIPAGWEINQSPNKIKVIGVGGGGNNAVSYMYKEGIDGVDFLVCNTDRQVLDNCEVPDKLILGEITTKGLGTGCDPEKGKKAAEESIEEIKKRLSGGTELVFITAGMGGGTGTGASPVIAEVAKSMGLLTIAVVTLPFRDERSEFMRRAIAGIKELEKHIDSLLIIDNQKLYTIYGDLPIIDAFPKANEVLNTAVRGISNIITSRGEINVDLNDVRTAMKDSGMALMGIGEGTGENRTIDAAQMAIDSPLLSNCDLSTARNVLINISTSREHCITASEMEQMIGYINEYTRSANKFKRGIRYDESLGEKISITLIVTGYNMMMLPHIPDPGKNPDDVITLDVNSTGSGSDRGRVDLDDDYGSFTGYSGKNSFKERYKICDTVPALITTSAADIRKLEKEPAYKRKGIKLTEENNESKE